MSNELSRSPARPEPRAWRISAPGDCAWELHDRDADFLLRALAPGDAVLLLDDAGERAWGVRRVFLVRRVPGESIVYFDRQRDFAALGLMALPLAMKAGTVPMHQWTPDTYSRAPHPVSAFLLVSSQASLFGLFRVAFTLFGAPVVSATSLGAFLAVLAALSMFIGVTMAIPQHDVKRLISHHAVSQTGYMLLGASVALAVLGDAEKTAAFGRDALAGSLFHMMNYAIYNGLLFLAAGAVVWRTGKRNLDDMGGLGRTMPVTMLCFGIGALAIAGIPPMSGFASKWVLYESVFRYSPLLAIVAMVVSLLTLASFVKVFQAMFLGPARKHLASVKEVPLAMSFPMLLLAAATIAIGLFPDVVMQRLLLPAAAALLK